MSLSRLFFMISMLLLLAGAASAATLHGTIYDIELNELNDVIVEVDSEPKQRYVSKDGAYSFELNPGDYVVTANYSPDELHVYSAVEEVSVKEEGDFVYDLFLFPGFDVEDEALLEEQDVLVESDTVVDESAIVSGVTIAIIAVVAIIILLIIYHLVGRRKKQAEREEIEEAEKLEESAKQVLKDKLDEANMRKPEMHPKRHKHVDKHDDIGDDYLKKVVEIIKKEGGRTTQKELRKQIPLSEAKISLMISELEHKKIVQKVKKGRGNIIILKKK